MTPIYRPEIAEFLENIHTVCGPALRLERDPLAVVRRYSAPADLEIAALICSTLAFGSVDLILRACDQALAPLGARPAEALLNMGARKIEESWARFQYRFCFPKDMIGLMRGAQGALREHGSLQALFLAGDDPEKPLTEALSSFVTRLRGYSAASTAFSIRPNLLPDPAQGSACKRLFLFLRWMVRQDDVDPGGCLWCLWIPTWRQPASIDLAFWTRNAPPLRRTSRTLCGQPPTSPSTLRKTRSSTISPSQDPASIRGRGMRFSAAIEKNGTR